MDNEVESAINATAGRAGMDPATWRAIASIESSLKPGSNSNNPATQYKGLFQIGSRGADSEWATHGSGNIYNAMDNANAAANLAASNNAWFQNKYGRAPSPVETYMMHQQGRGFYQNGTMTNISGNPYPGMSGPQTPGSFEAGWGREIARRAGLDPSQLMSGGSVASNTVGGGGARQPTSVAEMIANRAAAPDTDSGEDQAARPAANIVSMLAQQNQQNAPPPLQPLQMPQPMLTPAMLRARMLAQAMMNQPLPSTGTGTGDTGGGTTP